MYQMLLASFTHREANTQMQFHLEDAVKQRVNLSINEHSWRGCGSSDSRGESMIFCKELGGTDGCNFSCHKK